jgi:hypothetical protein
MQYRAPTIIASNSQPRAWFTLNTSVGQLLVIFSNPLKWDAFIVRASRMAASQGEGVGWISSKEVSSFDDAIRSFMSADSILSGGKGLAGVTFLSDSDPRADGLIASMDSYL